MKKENRRKKNRRKTKTKDNKEKQKNRQANKSKEGKEKCTSNPIYTYPYPTLPEEHDKEATHQRPTRLVGSSKVAIVPHRDPTCPPGGVQQSA